MCNLVARTMLNACLADDLALYERAERHFNLAIDDNTENFNMAVQETLKFWEKVLQDKSAQDRLCPKCGTEVYRSVLRLRGRNWHKACFQCTSCARTLNLATYTEVNNEIFCSDCYAECFSRRWRCSEIIDSKRLSKQLKNVVMEGHHFRWLQSKASSDSDSSNDETASLESALPEAPKESSEPSREPDEPAEPNCSVDEAVNESSEDEPSCQIAQVSSTVERPVCASVESLSTRNAHRPVRQISRGRQFSSEGTPEKRFEPSAFQSNRAGAALNEKVKADKVRLREPCGRTHAAAVQTDGPATSSRLFEIRRYSNIYAIRESPENSEDADPSESQSDSSSSVETCPTPPPKPFRLRKDSTGSISTAPVVDGVDGPISSSSRANMRGAGFRHIRRTRFPSDNFEAKSGPIAPCVAPRH